MLAAACVLLLLRPARAEVDTVLAALEAELGRAMQALSALDPAPYYLAVELVELEGFEIAAEDGALQGYGPQRERRLDVDIRIGAPDFDSSHQSRSGQAERPGLHGRPVPLGEDGPLIQRALWAELQARYAQARERWARVQADRQVLVEERSAPDLAPAEAVRALLPRAALALDRGDWEERLRQASARLAQGPVVLDGGLRLEARVETHWFASSEGAAIRHAQARYRLSAHADTIAEDGAALELNRTWGARDPAGLPAGPALAEATAALASTLAALREAPEQEPYTGPVLLSDRAAGVFFHEILGHRLEGHRLKQVEDAQTLRNLVGQPILPPFLSLVDDPTLARLAGSDLEGAFAFDAQGVGSQRTVLIDHGVLRGFLESRSPSAQDRASNGHGRRQAGYDPVARQGNLLVEAEGAVSDAALREELIALARARGLPYGLAIDEIQGGVTLTGRGNPNAYSVDVQLARRIYADGRPDELVRGVDLIGTPLVTLGRIVRAGELDEVFNGVCGAESGGVPVSAAAPALLIAEVETQRKAKAQAVPPLLPPPLPGEPRP